MDRLTMFLARLSFTAFGAKAPDREWNKSVKLRARLAPLWLLIVPIHFTLRVAWSFFSWCLVLFIGCWPNEPKWLLNFFSGNHEYRSPIYPWHVALFSWLASLTYVCYRVMTGTPFVVLPEWLRMTTLVSEASTIVIGVALIGIGPVYCRILLQLWSLYRRIDNGHLVELK